VSRKAKPDRQERRGARCCEFLAVKTVVYVHRQLHRRRPRPGTGLGRSSTTTTGSSSGAACGTAEGASAPIVLRRCCTRLLRQSPITPWEERVAAMEKLSRGERGVFRGDRRPTSPGSGLRGREVLEMLGTR